MRAVVTRVKDASVTIGGKVNGQIGQGFLVLLGVGPGDTEETARKLADENGKMNKSLEQVQGSLLVVSQFTLYADLKSRRPGFSHAAAPDLARDLYEKFLGFCADAGFPPQHGEFGADMLVASVNDGPVTLLFDTDAM